jgi:PHP family Zn ribbon phosphoesterase
MGREATVFVTKKDDPKFKITYGDITDAIKQEPDSKLKIGYTIEFYPEEGKYHFTGHRNCNFVQNPKETRDNGNICPVCHRPLTVGVMHRVEELAKTQTWPDEVAKLNPNGVKWIIDPSKKHPPFVKLVPLNEIIAESLHSTVSSQKVKTLFDQLCEKFGSEINVLLKISKEDITREAGPRIAEGIDKVRRGDIAIMPGYDGTYGIVKIWGEEKPTATVEKTAESQLGIDF